MMIFRTRMPADNNSVRFIHFPGLGDLLQELRPLCIEHRILKGEERDAHSVLFIQVVGEVLEPLNIVIIQRLLGILLTLLAVITHMIVGQGRSFNAVLCQDLRIFCIAAENVQLAGLVCLAVRQRAFQVDDRQVILLKHLPEI